jgi:hypothetical protein
VGTSSAPTSESPAPTRHRAFELPLSVVLLVFGAALTTIGALSHGGPLIAPGSALILVGAAWLGNALARRDVRLFPAAAPAPDEAA